MSATRAKLAGAVVAAISAVAVVLLILSTTAGSSGQSSAYSGALMPANVPVVGFDLHDQNGRPINLAQFKGHEAIVTFLYTTCPDICPLTAQQIRGAMDQAGHDVPVVAISVDPKRDTPTAARSWLKSEHLQGRMLWGLGSQAELEATWKRWAVLGQSAASDHSAYVFVLDRNGRRCVSWPVSHLTPEGLAHDLKLIRTRGGACRA